MGPIAKILRINRGNRFLTLTSTATKSVSIPQWRREHSGNGETYPEVPFNQGDVITTVLTCAGGETIHLTLDTTLPRSYSRQFTVRGTKGSYMQDTNTVFLDGQKEYWEPVDYYKKTLNNAVAYEAEYLPDCWKNVTPEALAAGHGGMDWLAYKSFVDAVKNRTEVPIDVYDGATWQAVSVLSEISIQQGGAPQAMPDFTNGAWFKRQSKDVCEL